LGNLINLTFLYLNRNQLSGEIPAVLGNLTKLQLLWLDNNKLSGSIPPELGKLTNLQFDLNLANNQLSGAIPAELGKLTNLQTLGLSLNQLSGAIPEDLSKLTNLLSLSLSNNKLTGAVPPSFASLTKLTGLFLQNNQLEDLPNLTGLSALRNLFLENNRFTFEDLEPNAPLFSRATVRYSPQAEVETDARSMGKDVQLSVKVGGQNNLYQWFKDGQAINGATANTFSVQNADLNATSQYHCQITNTLVTGLTIRSRSVSLQQAAFVVNSTGDQSDPILNDGVCDVDLNMLGDQCTLRAAIETVNAMGAQNAAITVARPLAFNISGSGVPVIRPPTALPIIKFPIVIDGTTQAAGRVRLTGPGGDVVGVAIFADGCTVKGLLIDGFSVGLGIIGNGNTVEENFMVGNNRGISIAAGANSIRRNIVAENKVEGIFINGESNLGPIGNMIEDNLIGTEDDGVTPAPNGIGVFIKGKLARQNTIKNNLISANNIGIQFEENSGNTVEGNRIGTTADGQSPLGNGIGVLLEKSAKSIIKNNVVADSRQSGIFVSEGSENIIEGNKIGTDASSATALGNGEHGVEIENAFRNLTKDNVISGNKGAGVFISGLRANENTIENNRIGANAAGTEPLGNGMEGVLIQDVAATNVVLNLISANGKSGIVIEGGEASESIIDNNSIGTDIFGGDVFGVMGNREHGVLIDRAPSSTLEENLIAFNHNAGIMLLAAPSGAVERNNIHHNVIGIDVQGEGSDELRIIGNRIHLNVTNINASNAEFIAQNNNVFNGAGAGTGIHLTRSHAVIQGNNLTGDAGDAITLEQGSTALITNNNVFGNRGMGVNNRNPSVSIAAQRNWWGNANGPGGAGPGSGDEVSAGVNFANWLAQPVAVVAAAEGDTLTLVAGRTDTVAVFLQNWQKPDDVLRVSISDNRGWLQEPKTFSVTLRDNLGAEARIAFAVPVGISDGSANNVRVIAASQTNSNAADTTTFTVVSQKAVLMNIRVVPDSVRMAPGDSAQFTASGVDQFGRDFNFTPMWSATGGVIDANGLYIAGNITGTFLVTAAGPNTQVQGQAVVRIEVTVAVEEDAPAIPTEFRLYQNYPNPFNPETWIQYDLPQATHVRVEIFNILGEKVKTLVDEKKPAGAYKIIWNGQTDNGKAAASGVYIYRLQAGGSSANSGQNFLQTRKMVFLR